MALRLPSALRWSLPSALTLGALVSGLSAVRFAAEGGFETAVICVVAAAILDGLDGHVARYLEACTKIGFELDSLCDCANFGVVPSLVVYFWARSLPASECKFEGCAIDHGLLWVACCSYTSCCALRLARFNVAGHAAEMDKSYPPVKSPSVPKMVLNNFMRRKLYFQGIPAPVAAAYALTPMILHFSALSRQVGAVGDAGAWAIGRRGTCAVLSITALLMVSPFPTFSSKMFKTSATDSHLRSRGALQRVTKAAAGVVLAACFWLFPFDCVLVLNLGHLVSIPFAAVVYYQFADGERRD